MKIISQTWKLARSNFVQKQRYNMVCSEKIYKKSHKNATELIKLCKNNENSGNFPSKRCIMTISR